MILKKTVAIIGATEAMGSSIAYRLAEAGYCVLLTDGSDLHRTALFGKLLALLTRIKLRLRRAHVRIIFSAREACWEADIIVAALPSQALPDLAHEIKEVVTGKIVLSIIDPLLKTRKGLGTCAMSSNVNELAQLLPHSRVIKAFIAIPSEEIENRNVRKPADVFIAGDDEAAVTTGMEIAKELRMRPHIGGKLAMSHALEQMMVAAYGLRLPEPSHILAAEPSGVDTAPEHVVARTENN